MWEYLRQHKGTKPRLTSGPFAGKDLRVSVERSSDERELAAATRRGATELHRYLIDKKCIQPTVPLDVVTIADGSKGVVWVRKLDGTKVRVLERTAFGACTLKVANDFPSSGVPGDGANLAAAANGAQ